MDATLVRVPIQRNRREENARIKAGEVPEDWSKAKRAQKDVDASRHKLVRNYRVTPANVHDSQVFDEVIDPDNEDPDVWADSAYRSEATEARLEGATYVSHIHEKGQAGQPLNDEQTQRNQARRGFVRGSSRCSDFRRTAWAERKSAPSAWRGRRSRSV